MLGGRQLCRGEEKALRGDVVCEEGNYPDQAMLLVVEALSLQMHGSSHTSQPLEEQREVIAPSDSS